MENNTEQTNNKQINKKKTAITITIVLLILAILFAGGWYVYSKYFNVPATPSDGVVGKVSSDWDTGADTNSSKSEIKGTQIPGYTTAEMKAGDTSLHLSIGNPKPNECGFYATLMLEDGTVLYESELLEPGSGLTEVPLSKTLEKGEYNALVSYRCVTLDETQDPLNSAESGFTLIVN